MESHILLKLITKHFKVSWRSGDILTEVLITIAISFVLAIRGIHIFKLKEIIPVIQQIMPFLFVIAFGTTPLSILISVIKEKSLGYKTIQIVIYPCCNSYIYTLSWVLIGYCRMLICIASYTISQLIFMWMIGFDWDKFYHVSFMSTIVQLLVFGFLAINQQFMIASFLNNVLAASSVYLYICFFYIFWYFVLQVKSIAANRLFYIVLTSISPQCQCGLAFSYLATLKTQQFTSPFEVDIFPYALITFTFPQKDVIQFMLMLYCLYTIIFLYADQVMPNSFGSSKPMTFFFDFFKTNHQPNYNLIEQQDQDDLKFENKNLRQQFIKDSKQSCIQIRNLYKTFNDFQALNNINVDIYEGEIFCLLGHNGAGKTTLINCLTGMLQSTSGKVKIFGKLLLILKDKALKIQQDSVCNLIVSMNVTIIILFLDLTVYEHLLLVSSIKESNIDDIQEIMVLTQLMDFQHLQANKLSTGQRRLLSFAMALIGGSKILFLDEKLAFMSLRSGDMLTEILVTIAISLVLAIREIIPIQHIMPFLFVIAFGSAPLALLIAVMKEKSLGYKTIQIIQGCNNYIYTLSWIVIGYFRMLICITAFALSQLLFNWIVGFDWDKFYHVSFTSTIVQLLVFSALAVNQQFMIASFFKDVLAASSVHMYICFFQIFPYFVLQVKSIAANRLYYIIITSISPQCGLAFSFLSSLKTQQSSNPFEVDLFPHELIHQTFSQQDIITLMVILYVIYTIIFLYVEQVMPNSFGSSKSFLYCLDWFRSNQHLSYNPIDAQDQDDEWKLIRKNLKFQVITSNNQTCIQIRNLYKNFQNFQALIDINLDIHEGEIFCLLGHNGAGKTTLINCLTGMLPTTSGKVRVFGNLIDSDRIALKNLIGFCMQFDNLYEYLTVNEHLLLVSQIKQQNVGDIQEIMLLTQLMDFQNLQANKLSTGQRRLLSFAMALIGGSKILFLDEPTSAMDGVSRKKIWEIIRNIKSQNRTIILTSHDLSEVEELSDRIGILNHGELIILGDKEFINSELGGGYELHLYYDNQNSSQFQEIEVTICREFQEVSIKQSNIQLLRQTFQIKSKSKEVILNLINTIEDICKIKYTLKPITLEQAFETITENIDLSNTLEIQSWNNYIFKPLHTPKYNLNSQVRACFIKKWQNISSDQSSIIYITMPILAFFVGPLVIGQINFSDLIGPVLMKNIIIEYVQLQFIASSLIMGLCPNIILYVYIPANENQLGLKQLSDVIGVNKLAYWMGLYFIDFLQYIFIIIVFYITSWVYDLSIMFKYFYQIVYILGCFAPFYIIHYYLLSFWFKQSENAIKYLPLFSFFIEFIAANFIIVVFQHHFNSMQYAIQIGNSYEILLTIISPPFALYRALIFTNDRFRLIKPFIKHKFPYTTYWPYTYLIIFSAVIHVILLYYLETRQTQQQYNKTLKQENKDLNILDQSSQKEQNIIVCDCIEKQYTLNQGTVLKQISFNVGPGEFMIIVGPNGAGKTTIMNIISELSEPSSGSLSIYTQNIDRGICPQYNNFQDNLTCKQNLCFQSRIKNLSYIDFEQEIEFYLQTLNLRIYSDIKAKHLSGGNKRKLSFAISLIGGSRLVFLDEPLTGVDPNSRQAMIDLLQLHRNKYGSTIILASPNIDGIADYCNKIAIIFDGEFNFIGSPNQLMDQYQLGMKVDISFNEQVSDIESIKLRLQSFFQDIIMAEYNQQRLICFIKSKVFSDVFTYFTKLHIDGTIKDFEVYDNSLDQIFIHLSQENESQSRLNRPDQIDFKYE